MDNPIYNNFNPIENEQIRFPKFLANTKNQVIFSDDSSLILINYGIGKIDVCYDIITCTVLLTLTLLLYK